jgi:GH25 family lysozyme M1 (1,4-beta-N-acetylmuramidase)
MFPGIDISSAQGNLTQDDWATIAKSFSFALLECGIGNDGMSSVYAANKGYASNVGMKVMPYHFLYCLPDDGVHLNRDPVGQANLHFSYSPGKCCADLEFPVKADWAQWDVPNAAFIEDWVNAYMEQMKTLSGSYPILYCYPYYLSTINNPASFAQYSKWLALYASNGQGMPAQTPDFWDNWVIWQSANNGRLPNGTTVDLDLCQGLYIFE